MKYLDPKADLTFKKIFGKHPDLLISLFVSPRNSKALEGLKISAFNEAELRAYDKFWDGVRVERSMQHDSYEEGRADGVNNEKVATVKRMLSAGFSPEQISVATSMAVSEIEKLL